MSIKELQEVYAKHPNVAGLASLRKNKDIKTVYLEGMHGSCASLFASVSVKTIPGINVFILNDLEEAGYFYHDLVQVDPDKAKLDIRKFVHFINGFNDRIGIREWGPGENLG